MKKVSFLKYTSCGNNFVIVDNTQGEVLSELDFSYFATKATNVAFGVGCDNLLVLQKANKSSLRSIAQVRNYWQTIPDFQHAEYIFRMFEPNGEEALCCGNGLACIANYLSYKYNIQSTEIITEIPLATPSLLNIGSTGPGQGGWVNLGEARKVPSSLANQQHLTRYNDVLDSIELPIKFRGHDLKPYTAAETLRLKAYLVFTGEPHLVVLAKGGFSEPKIAEFLFSSAANMVGHPQPREQRSNFGSWLVNRIGHYINDKYRDIFPNGVNVNFARSIDSVTVENRCFERGVNIETLACGTGAIAVASVLKHLHVCDTPKITVLPLKCRIQDPKAKMHIQQTKDGWLLKTNPQLLFEGEFRMVGSPTSSQTRLKQSDAFAA